MSLKQLVISRQMRSIMREATQTWQIPSPPIRLHLPLPLLGLIIMTGSFVATFIFGLLAYQIYFLDRIHLGVQVDGVAVETMTRAELRRLVTQQADSLLQRPITLTSPEGSWTMTAAELGASVDVEQTVRQAFLVGRGGAFAADLRSQYQTMQQALNIEPLIGFDSGPANIALSQIAAAFNRPPRNAQLILNDDLTLSVISPQPGRTVDIEATREAIRKAIIWRGQTAIPLKINYTQPAISEVEPVRQQVELLLSRPLTFSFGDRSWDLTPAEIARLISFEQEIGQDGVGRIIARIDQTPLYAYFHALAPEINRAPVNAWFDLDVSTWTLYPIVYAQEGWTLDVERAVAMTVAQLSQPTQQELALPVIVESPAVPAGTAEMLGIRELVSSNTTYFKGSSAERMQNIAVSASKFHGLVIPPGGIFSFNEYLGEVTTANGFVESLIIKGDRTAVGIGGGICQVSTTVFRAAFFGGFEIVERWAHGYRVSWYETGSVPGLDATIYTPTVDFKFRNDTDSYLLIQTATDLNAGTVTFNFYGTSPGRTVIVSDPIEANRIPHGEPIYEVDPTLEPGTTKQVDWAKDGLDVTIYRTVLAGDQVLHQDTLFSRYRPWRAVYKIGPTEN